MNVHLDHFFIRNNQGRVTECIQIVTERFVVKMFEVLAITKFDHHFGTVAVYDIGWIKLYLRTLMMHSINHFVHFFVSDVMNI